MQPSSVGHMSLLLLPGAGKQVMAACVPCTSKTARGSCSQKHKKRPCAGRHAQNPEVLAVHRTAPQPVALARQGRLGLQTRTRLSACVTRLHVVQGPLLLIPQSSGADGDTSLSGAHTAAALLPVPVHIILLRCQGTDAAHVRGSTAMAAGLKTHAHMP